MKVDSNVVLDVTTAGTQAEAAEAAGYCGVWVSETNKDPFLPLVLAAEHTQRMDLGTAIAVAFARSPLTTAQTAWDLQAYSQGRFILGLGSQIKPHIERRFSMPWSHPAPRMAEFISAMRAIWESWQHGTKLNFRGDFYQHTLMTPFFSPRPSQFGAPKVFLAAVGDMMTAVAAEVADGMLVHGFSTERYLREVTLPAIEGGLARSGRARRDFQLAYPIFVVTGLTEADRQTAATAVRRQIAFYGSTPAYRPVLDRHGWGDLQTDLTALSKRGEWAAMGDLITDDILDAFAVEGAPDEIAPRIKARLGGMIDRISLYTPYEINPEVVAPALEAFSAGD